MTDSATLAVRLAPEVKQHLESVARRVHRSESLLAAEAIEEFLAVQEWQTRGRRRGHCRCRTRRSHSAWRCPGVGGVL